MKNSSQSWIIILSILAVALSIALLLTYKNQRHSRVDKRLEREYQQAQQVATYLPPQEIVKPNPSPSAPVSQYAIQIMSLNDKAKAQEAANKFAAAGIPGYVVPTDLGDKGIKYRVLAGPFTSKDEAAAKLPEIKTKYKDAFILRI